MDDCNPTKNLVEVCIMLTKKEEWLLINPTYYK